MELTAKVFVQSNKEQTTLAQQIMETSQLVTQMAAWQGSGGGNSEAGAVGGCGAGQPPGSPPAHRALHHPTPGRFRQEEEVPFHWAALPKLSFPKFNGDNPWIWIDKCRDYFSIFNIPECMWTTTTSLHMEDNETKWLQVYKLKVGLGNWSSFVAAVEQKFGAFDYRKVIHELLALRREGSVEE
jgi:hypothetical protein